MKKIEIQREDYAVTINPRRGDVRINIYDIVHNIDTEDLNAIFKGIKYDMYKVQGKVKLYNAETYKEEILPVSEEIVEFVEAMFETPFLHSVLETVEVNGTKYSIAGIKVIDRDNTDKYSELVRVISRSATMYEVLHQAFTKYMRGKTISISSKTDEGTGVSVEVPYSFEELISTKGLVYDNDKCLYGTYNQSQILKGAAITIPETIANAIGMSHKTKGIMLTITDKNA